MNNISKYNKINNIIILIILFLCFLYSCHTNVDGVYAAYLQKKYRKIHHTWAYITLNNDSTYFLDTRWLFSGIYSDGYWQYNDCTKIVHIQSFIKSLDNISINVKESHNNLENNQIKFLINKNSEAYNLKLHINENHIYTIEKDTFCLNDSISIDSFFLSIRENEKGIISVPYAIYDSVKSITYSVNDYNSTVFEIKLNYSIGTYFKYMPVEANLIYKHNKLYPDCSLNKIIKQYHRDLPYFYKIHPKKNEEK